MSHMERRRFLSWARRMGLATGLAALIPACGDGRDNPQQEETPEPTPPGEPVNAAANVREYGAKGDGAADDTEALQRAFQEMAAPSGPSMLFFPPGTYRIREPLTIPLMQHKTIFGAGPGATVLLQESPGAPIIRAEFPDTHSITLRDLSLNYASPQSDAAAVALLFTSSSSSVSGFYHWTVDRCWFQHAYVGIGIRGDPDLQIPVWDTTFSNLLFRGIRQSAIDMESPRTIGMPNHTYENVRVLNYQTYGVTSEGPAIKLTAVAASLRDLDIEGWRNTVLAVTGGMPVTARHVHVEWHRFTGEEPRLVYAANGAVAVESVDVSGESESNVAAVFRADQGAEIFGEMLDLRLERSSGDLWLCSADHEARGFWFRGVIDRNGTVVMPSASSATNAKVRLLNGDFQNGVRLAGRTITCAGGPPDGHATKGDIVFNTGAEPGGHVGWVCVEGGTPGRWKAFGAVED